MRVKTEDGRIFTLRPGTLFDCEISEPEWFPVRRADVFEVGFMSPGQKVPVFKTDPEVGDFIAVDFQQNGPWGDIWKAGPVVEILDKETAA